MPIISLSSFKGGVAKTTSAICLASLFCEDGATLVIDADPNRSATTWALTGGLPFQVCGEKEAAKLMRSRSFEFIIFDTPARPNDVEVEELARGCDTTERYWVEWRAIALQCAAIHTKLRSYILLCLPSLPCLFNN